MRADNTEFAIGIIFVFLGSYLLYADYNTGYWGIVALGLIFVLKNWSAMRGRPIHARPGMAEKPKSDRIINERINH
jgi:hypothetical protein